MAALLPSVRMIVLIMGVEGAGKTTIGKLLANRLRWDFSDADDFHSEHNRQKMRRGIPLDDADREPWLQAIRTAMLGWVAQDRHVVLACSALKKRYREVLDAGPEVRVVYLKGDFDVISRRLAARSGHFVSPALLHSQFQILEEPENALTVDADRAPEEIVQEIVEKLAL